MGELGDVLLVAAVAQLGVAAERAEAAARRVDEHGVEVAEGLGQRLRRVAGLEAHALAHAQAAGLGFDFAQLVAVEVDGEDVVGLREVTGLAAGRGAGVHHAGGGGHLREDADQLRGLVLHLPQALGEAVQVLYPARRLEDDADGGERRGARLHADLGELREQLVARHLRGVGADGDGGRLVVGGEHHAGALGAELAEPAAHQPLGVALLHRELDHLVGGRWERQRARAARACGGWR